jgi:hypothetical protein
MATDATLAGALPGHGYFAVTISEVFFPAGNPTFS